MLLHITALVATRRCVVTYKCFFVVAVLRLGHGAFIVPGISRMACVHRCILFSVKRLGCACRVCNTHLYSATERKPNIYNDDQVISDGE